MNVRIVKVDELQFLICIKNKVWASNFNSFKKWQNCDKIVFTVERKIAAIANVIGNQSYSEEFLWDNGLFPHRIKISFKSILNKNNRVAISEIKELLTNSWGRNYGWGIQNQTPLNLEDGIKLLGMVNKDNDIDYFERKIDFLISESKTERNEEDRMIGLGKISENERRYKPSIVVF